MAKAEYAVVGGTTRKIKKEYAVIGGTTRAIKKKYAVIDGKTRLIWGGGIDKFLFSQQTASYLSSDGITYTKNTALNPKSFDVVIYAQDKFWACSAASYQAYIYNSTDGITWTLVATINNNNYFGNSVFRYQNGVFILIGEHVGSSSSYKNMAYSTDGTTWTSVKVTLSDSFSYARNPIDIRYGTVGDVAGWYVFSSNDTTMIKLHRFSSIDDIKTGNLTLVASQVGVIANVSNTDCAGKLCIRNNKAYMFYTYYTGSISNTNNSVSLVSCNGSSFTTIGTNTGHTIDTVWSTDKYFLYRSSFYTSSATENTVRRYNFETETYEKISPYYFRQSIYGHGVDTGVFVGSRIYQTVVDSDYIMKGAYSDDYGTTVTLFTTDYSCGVNDTILVHGSEGGGFYQEVY